MADWHPFYEAVRTAFAANSSLVSLAPSTQWFADQLPDRANTFPALRYALILNTPHQRLGSGGNVTADLQVDGYHDREKPAELKPLMDQVVIALDRVSLTATGFTSVKSMCTRLPTFGKEEPYYRMKAIFRLYGNAS